MSDFVYDQAYEAIAHKLESFGLPLETNFRVSEHGFVLSKLAIRVLTKAGMPEFLADAAGGGVSTLDGVGFNRIGGYWHHLSDYKPDLLNGEGWVNSWAAASMAVNAAAGWLEDGDPEKGLEFLRFLVVNADPMIDVKHLLWKARYDDRALLRLIQLASDGLSRKAEQSGKSI